MAYVKPDEVRKMNPDERLKTLFDLRKELQHERGVAAMGGSPPSPGKIRQIRRQIARILTIQNEERLGIRGQTVNVTAAQAKPELVTPEMPHKGPAATAAKKAHAKRVVKHHKAAAKHAKKSPAKHAPKAKSHAKKPAAHAKPAKTAKGAKKSK